MTLSCGAPACPPSLDLDNDPEMGGVYVSATYISSQSTINATGGNVDYSAGDFVTLIEGFEVALGAVFNALIGGCGDAQLRVGSNENSLGKSRRE